jgi:hypothetical protein
MGRWQAERADVSLGPLAEAETTRLVESLLGRDPAHVALRATVVERAAGNPLYAEEFVRMQAAGADVEGLPDSVLGIVTARVDLLPQEEKELLRDAAVMGGVVRSDGLGAVSERDAETVDGLLRSLGRKEFLRRERRSAVLGASEHSFVHALVRDAVYAQLPRPDRVERHVRVAHWIESLPEDRREDRAELLAHHYLEAIELARSAGLDVSDIEPRAAAALREAGMRAFSIGAYPAAVRALRGAADRLPEGLDPTRRGPSARRSCSPSTAATPSSATRSIASRTAARRSRRQSLRSTSPGSSGSMATAAKRRSGRRAAAPWSTERHRPRSTFTSSPMWRGSRCSPASRSNHRDGRAGDRARRRVRGNRPVRLGARHEGDGTREHR